MSIAIPITDANFEEEVINSGLPVLVDFWADWCPPCRLMDPIVEALAVELAGRIRVAKVDSDACPDTAGRFGVMSIPTLMVFKDGQPLGRVVGYQPKLVLQQKIEDLLSRAGASATAAPPPAR
jgi:thioredoxin 1